ncbi:transmembrane protein 59-like [Vespula squamosa]|uniref:Transmembrane protein 59-like n=1 Tax=Vespula squamosa TaxID=30214 RepID=A0ABD2APA6_VESSQ
MKKFKESAILLMLFLINIVYCDICYNFLNREDPCITLCEKTPFSFANSKYIKSCCQRGCRFFNLVDLNSGLEPNSLNGTRNACTASCKEAYAEPQDRYACSTGCDLMAKQRVFDLLSLFSIAIYLEEHVDSNTLLMYPDIPENDILKDPGIRKELLPRWWDSNGFKLPETHIKTVPMDAKTMNYETTSDYAGESKPTSSWISGSDWFQCASKHTVMPPPLFAPVAAAAAAILTVCMYLYNLYLEKRYYTKELAMEKAKALDEITSYTSDEESLNENLPPKYTDIDDELDDNVKV